MAVLEGFLSERQEITGLSLPVFAYGCRSTRGVSISSDCREESFVKVDSPWKLSPSALKAFFSSPQRGGIAYLNCALADSIPSDISRAITLGTQTGTFIANSLACIEIPAKVSKSHQGVRL